MLKIADLLLTIIHLAIISFNLLGWIFPITRRLHFIVILCTAFCWLILGIWYGLGYCPVTDLQWRVKEMLGEKNLPGSFITYCLYGIGLKIPVPIITKATGILFGFAGFMSLYFNILNTFMRKIRIKRSA